MRPNPISPQHIMYMGVHIMPTLYDFEKGKTVWMGEFVCFLLYILFFVIFFFSFSFLFFYWFQHIIQRHAGNRECLLECWYIHSYFSLFPSLSFLILLILLLINQLLGKRQIFWIKTKAIFYRLSIYARQCKCVNYWIKIQRGIPIITKTIKISPL